MAMRIQSRFMDLCDEPVDHLLSPIKGYQDQQLVSLDEAIQPVSQFFNEIEDNVFVALHNCQHPTDGLDQQESAAIHLYTMQFDGGPSLYQVLNQALRAENRQELKPWFAFLNLFLTALYKLPSENKTIWRGVKDVDLSSKYKTGTKFAWWGVSSCTTNIQVLESEAFLGKTGERTLFSIESINGKSIVNHSYYKQSEKEVILMPGSYFEVIGQLNPAHQLHIIQLQEIQPPIQLVKPPFSKSSSSSLTSQSKSNTISKPTTIKSEQQIVVSSQDINQRWKQHATTVVGGHGKGDRLNQLSYPCGMFIDDDQTIYVADFGNHRIVEWKKNATNGQIAAGGNGRGNRNDQLDHPTKVIVGRQSFSHHL